VLVEAGNAKSKRHVAAPESRCRKSSTGYRMKREDFATLLAEADVGRPVRESQFAPERLTQFSLVQIGLSCDVVGPTRKTCGDERE
jgi:hypothetical protein